MAIKSDEDFKNIYKNVLIPAAGNKNFIHPFILSGKNKSSRKDERLFAIGKNEENKSKWGKLWKIILFIFCCLVIINPHCFMMMIQL